MINTTTFVLFYRTGEHARAVSILDVEANNYLVFHEDALKEILLRNDIQDLPLAVISVVGAFGKGKSFLQDFFIRFLRVLVIDFGFNLKQFQKIILT